jgi:hypothetical protein
MFGTGRSLAVTMHELWVAATLLSGLMVGCARNDVAPLAADQGRVSNAHLGASIPVPGASTSGEKYIATVNTHLQSITQAALAEAARHTGLAASALKLVSAESVTWSDGSLGCPQPGMLYTQALVPGYRIRIEARGELLDYHANARGGLSLCPAGRSMDPLPGDSRI